MMEIFTIGGGEYIVNVLNAVAAWSGGGGFRSMLQVVFVMGLIYSLLVLAFNFDWRAWMNWRPSAIAAVATRCVLHWPLQRCPRRWRTSPAACCTRPSAAC